MDVMNVCTYPSKQTLKYCSISTTSISLWFSPKESPGLNVRPHLINGSFTLTLCEDISYHDKAILLKELYVRHGSEKREVSCKASTAKGNKL